MRAIVEQIVDNALKTCGQPWDELDSLSKLEMLVEVEDKLDINLPIDRADEWSTSAAFVDFVTEVLKNE